jgi:hypothetical protein
VTLEIHLAAAADIDQTDESLLGAARAAAGSRAATTKIRSSKARAPMPPNIASSNVKRYQCSGAMRRTSVGSKPLFQKNLHVVEVKGHRVRLEEIVADHAREVEAKHAFPRERPIVETRDVVFPDVAEGKLPQA